LTTFYTVNIARERSRDANADGKARSRNYRKRLENACSASRSVNRNDGVCSI